MDVITVHETVSGRRLEALSASAWSWRRQVSGAGALSVAVPMTQDTVGMDLRTLLAPWRTSLALSDSTTGRVIAAGPIYARRWDADSYRLEISCADLWDIFKLRLVLDPSVNSWSTGSVLGQDGTWPGAWSMSLTGSMADIARGLLASTLRAGPLPIVLPPITGGDRTRTYGGPDFATVAARLEELTQVIGGPEIIFHPRLVEGSTAVSWHMLTGSPELVVATHSWDARRRAVPLVDITVEEDASDMVGDSWARGGSQDDRTLIAHHHDRWLEDAGWPLLQAADTSHSSVSDLSTLGAWAQSATQMRAHSTEVVQLKARRRDEAGYALADALTPGDHIHLRHEDPYLGSSVIDLKALELSGDQGEWVTVSCREAADEGSV